MRRVAVRTWLVAALAAIVVGSIALASQRVTLNVNDGPGGPDELVHIGGQPWGPGGEGRFVHQFHTVNVQNRGGVRTETQHWTKVVTNADGRVLAHWNWNTVRRTNE